MGIVKHRTSGYAPGPDHFTGKRAGKKKRRKGRVGINTLKMRMKKRNSATNKYEEFSKAGNLDTQ